MKYLVSTLLILLTLTACKEETQTTFPTNKFSNQYSITEGKIAYNEEPIQLIGANAFHVFGAGGSDMKRWNLDIAREFVGNVAESPLSGFPILDATGAYLHSLQAVVDSNRSDGRITIICPFGWNGADSTLFTGRMPSSTFWWEPFKSKLQEWAVHFKDQPDVWLEVWNEPYRFDRADGYTDDIWMQDMNQLTDVIRSTGNPNIILIPCAEQGQDESVLIKKGNLFLKGQQNILFDIHAYEKWLLVSNSEIERRLKLLQDHNLPFIFGEIAPINASLLMNPRFFLEKAYTLGTSICAWVWKYDGSDQNALLTEDGFPNDNNNNSWGTTYQSLSRRERMP